MKLRLAQEKDIAQIEALMKRSMAKLGKGYYTQEQIESCCEYVCVPDVQLIDDQTFFVMEDQNDQLIGCGGWSFRNKLYAGPDSQNQDKASTLDPKKDFCKIRAMFTDPEYSGKGIGSAILQKGLLEAKGRGFQKAALGSTLSGFDFYKAKGWLAGQSEEATLPDGVSIGVVHMSYAIN